MHYRKLLIYLSFSRHGLQNVGSGRRAIAGPLEQFRKRRAILRMAMPPVIYEFEFPYQLNFIDAITCVRCPCLARSGRVRRNGCELPCVHGAIFKVLNSFNSEGPDMAVRKCTFQSFWICAIMWSHCNVMLCLNTWTWIRKGKCFAYPFQTHCSY